MTMQSARVELHSKRSRLASLIQKVSDAPHTNLDPELSSHLARYLVVRLCGDTEQSVRLLMSQYVKEHADSRVFQYFGKSWKRSQNITKETLKQLISALDLDWWETVENQYPDELDAFDSIYSSRNGIAHGDNQGITITTVIQYEQQVWTVLEFLDTLVEPVS